jgi:hypothetical protein
MESEGHVETLIGDFSSWAQKSKFRVTFFWVRICVTEIQILVRIECPRKTILSGRKCIFLITFCVKAEELSLFFFKE